MRAFVPPVIASAILLALAPFWGVAQRALQSAVPRGLLIALGGLFVAGVVGVVVAALIRIRSDKGPRYGLLIAALAMAAIPALLSERGSLITEAVERLHLVLFSLIAILFYRAFTSPPRPSGWTSIALAWVATSIVGILDEAVQGLVSVRTGEIYDIGLNSYSALVGVLLAVALLGLPARSDTEPGRARESLGRLLAVAILLLAVFFEVNHLGHRYDDPEIGLFNSYVRPGRFDELNADRSVRWAEELPGPRSVPSTSKIAS